MAAATTTSATSSPEKRGNWKARLSGGSSRRSSPSPSRWSNKGSNATDDEKKEEERDQDQQTRSLSASRKENSQKKGMRGRLRNLLPRGNSSSKKNSHHTAEQQDDDNVGQEREEQQSTGIRSPLGSSLRTPVAGSSRLAGGNANVGGLICEPWIYFILFFRLLTYTFSTMFYQASTAAKESLFQWQDEMEEEEQRSMIHQKQQIKERDGFCRRVDTYDGQVIVVDNVPTYELGNYLGGGVAGVVYEGHRLRPIEEYPVRTGIFDVPAGSQMGGDDTVINTGNMDGSDEFIVESGPLGSLFCAPATIDVIEKPERSISSKNRSLKSDRTDLTGPSTTSGGASLRNEEEMAIEATCPTDTQVVMIDTIDAPSRSKHYAKAVAFTADSTNGTIYNNTLMEETVAIKILNPVGFRTMDPDLCKNAVIVRKGEDMEPNVKKGTWPMEERHVWWLVNPNSRNLRTLQRYSADRRTEAGVRTPRVDRGSPEKGLRISLVAAFVDPKTNQLRELSLTRCIEIWGHIPFSATESGKFCLLLICHILVLCFCSERLNLNQIDMVFIFLTTTGRYYKHRVQGNDGSY